MPVSKKGAKRAAPLTLGNYIMRLRLENEFSLRKLAKCTGISLASLSRLERGDHVPSIQRNIAAIDKLWVVLGGDMNQMLYMSRRCPVCSGSGTLTGVPAT
jgi:DNA-binding Xre family transcriptional regulator|tara:strand:+ start:607 stop:909 length:303 start_codon:yes stop_codon:yes gene_type:complete